MTQMKKLATKFADLSLISGTPVVERKNLFHLELSPDLNMHSAIHMLTQIHECVQQHTPNNMKNA